MIGGVLYTADFYGCKVIDSRLVYKAFIEALKEAKANVIYGSDRYHVFPNDGLSATVLLQESHSAIHTWPEEGFVTFELFTCGETVNTLTAINALSRWLECSDYTTNRHSRFSKDEIIPRSIGV